MHPTRRQQPFSLSSFANLYLQAALALLLAFFHFPVIVYLLFALDLALPLSLIYSLPAFLLLLWRLVLLISQELPLSNPALRLVWASLLAISARAFLGYFEMRPGQHAEYLRSLPLTIAYPWLLVLGGEALAYKYRAARSLLLLPLTLTVLVVLSSVAANLQQYGRFHLYFHDYESGVSYNYHWLGDTLAILSLLLSHRLLAQHRLGLWIAFTLSTLMLLLLTLSRTSFIAFLASVVAMPFLHRFDHAHPGRLTTTRYLLAILLLLVATAAALIAFSDLLGEVITRISSLLSGDDPSLQERRRLMGLFWKHLAAYGIFGGYLYELNEEGKGLYVHNMLSYWLEYGLLPFAMFLLALLASTRTSFKHLPHPVAGSAVIVLIFVLIALAARAYVWPFVWFAMAYAAAVRPWVNHNNRPPR